MSGARKPTPQPLAAERATPAAVPLQACAPSPLPSYSMGNLLNLLVERAEASLTDSELRWLADECAADAEQQARNASDLAVNIAGLVASDGGETTAGNFRDRDGLSSLMLHMGATFDAVAALAELGQSAAGILWSRRGRG